MKTSQVKAALAFVPFMPPLLITLASGGVMFVVLHSAHVVKGDISIYEAKMESASIHLKKAPTAHQTLLTGLAVVRHGRG